MKKIKSLFLGLAMICAMPTFAQNKVVTGTVVDDLGEPVIGATVRVQGTKTATVTDFDGNYKIEVPKGGKVVVSYIGFKDTPTTGGKVQLATSSNDLEEVVVVGYGVQKKAHLTGSVGSVPMDDIQDLAGGSLGSALSGLVNGLSTDGGESRPGERTELYVRDAKSISALKGTKDTNTSNEPLYVIDGYIYPNDVKMGDIRQNLGAEAFSNLDPAEVESISVLKDAAAAIYGARGANGVILVTTKKGKVGKPRISYSGTFGIADEVSRPSLLDAYNYGRLYNIMATRNDKDASFNPQTQIFQYDELQMMKNLNYDLLDKYWSSAFTQKHNVNVGGATDAVSYFGSIGYFKQDGNLGKLDYDRWNYRAGIDVKINQWLSANIAVSGDYGKKNTPYVSVGGSSTEDYSRLMTRPRYMPEYVNGYPLMPSGVGEGTSNLNTYHYDILQNSGDYSNTQTSNTTINAGVKLDFGFWKPLKGLKASFSYSKSINTSKTNQYATAYDLYEMNIPYGSGFHVYDPTGEEYDYIDYTDASNYNKRPQTNGNFLSRQMLRTDNYQMNFTLQYQRKFGLHDVSALFSIEKSEAESEYNLTSATAPYEFTNYQYTGIDHPNSKESLRFGRAESAMLSYIWRVNYAYSDRYLAEVLLRSDSSPAKFGPKNKWGTFPTFSLGWAISEESWFKNAKWLKWLDYLKLRVSYGVTGRDNIAPWQWQANYNLDLDKGAVFGEDNKTQATTNRIGMNKNTAANNPDVHWSKSYKFNLGIDARFLDRRLNLTFDYYHERNRDILLNYSGTIPSIVGNQSAPYNYGKMNNWGWELSLSWRDKIGKDFKYHVTLNTGYSDNKVLDQEWATSDFYKAVKPGDRADTGLWGYQCLGMFRDYHDIDQYWAEHLTNPLTGEEGTYLGKTKDQMRPGMLIYKDVRGAYDPETGLYADKDYSITKEDEVQLSTRSNNIYGFTMNAGAEWKGISLTLQFAAHWGAYDTVAPAALGATGTYTDNFYNMPSFWNPDNVFVYDDIYDGSGRLVQKANHAGTLPNPGFAENRAASSYWRISAARVSLNRLTIAYSLPKNWLKGSGLQNVRLNLTGQNLINFYNPNPDGYFNPMAGTYGKYPNLRKWTFGVNVTF